MQPIKYLKKNYLLFLNSVSVYMSLFQFDLTMVSFHGKESHFWYVSSIE